jgi:hypothetical protein
MLTYLPGEVISDSIPWPAWAYADSTLVQVGQWMRRIHDATAVFIPPKDERWFTGSTMQPGWIVGHQDAAPYNAVMDGDRLVGFFDWDTASPSPRDDDLAFSALLWVPLTAPDAGEQSDSHNVRNRSRRLHLLLDAYRYDGDRRAFGAMIVQRARRQAGTIRSMAEAGDRAAIALLPMRAASSSPRRTSRRCRATSGLLSAGCARDAAELATRRISTRRNYRQAPLCADAGITVHGANLDVWRAIDEILRDLTDRVVAALAQLNDLGLELRGNERRRRGFFPMLSMIGHPSWDKPPIMDVRQSSSASIQRLVSWTRVALSPCRGRYFGRQKVLGEDYPATLTTRYRPAWIIGYRHQYVEAEQML